MGKVSPRLGQALEYLRRRVDADPGAFEDLASLAALALQASTQYRDAGELRTALALGQESVRAARLASARDPDGGHEVLYNRALLHLADCLVAADSPLEALDIVDEAVESARSRAAESPDDPASWRVLAGASDMRAGLVAAQGDLVTAMEHADEAVAAYRALARVAGGPEETMLLAKGLHNRAVTSGASGDLAAAQRDVAEAIDLYRAAISAGARHGEALLSRALQARTAIGEASGAAAGEDAGEQAAHAYVQAVLHDPRVAAVDFGTASSSVRLTGFGSQEPDDMQPGLPEGSPTEGTSAVAERSNTYVDLATAIESVRDELRAAAHHAAGSDLQFEVGTVELEFGVELRTDSARGGGVRVMVLAGGPERASSGAQHRIRLELTPRSRSGDLLVGGGAIEV
ncbi:trypco2 family protein [Embleya sp. NPDC001921]